jgi:DNA repair protein RadD
MKTPRDYQQAALDSLFEYLRENEGNPLIVAPVGSGKSLMMAETIKKAHELKPRARIVVLTHVKELLVQNSEELSEQYPECDYGFYCASLKQKRLHNDVTFASIQSIHNKIGKFNRAPNLILVDECHLISHKTDTQYRRFIDSALALNPSCRIVGFTGTPFRADTGRIDEGENRLFDDIAYEIGIKYMIDNGYLAKPITPQVKTKMDVSNVGTRNGDYIAGQLERAIDTGEITKDCVAEIVHHAEQTNRKKWLIFTAGLAHCEHVRDEIRRYGITCEMITGKTPSEERDKIIQDYKDGKIQCLVNVAVLTTGFNAPDIDLIAFMRPTKSPVLYIQCLGRGMRIAEGKEDCLVLDFGGVIDELGAIDQINIKKNFIDREKGEGEAVTKTCPKCEAICYAAQRYCYECSYDFGVANIQQGASTNRSLLSEPEPPMEIHVMGMRTHKHHKSNNPENTATMCVTYTTMHGGIKEWVCFNHTGFARNKAEKWHNKFLPDFDAPLCVDDALDYEYPTPEKIIAHKEGKYWRVDDYIFPENDELEDVEISF